MTTLKINVWLDSGANHQSIYKTEFEIDKDRWNAMTDDQKDDYARDYAWQRMDWGWIADGEDT